MAVTRMLLLILLLPAVTVVSPPTPWENQKPPNLQIHGIDLWKVLYSGDWEPPVRDLGVVEICSGMARIVTAARCAHHAAEPFDPHRTGLTAPPGNYKKEDANEAEDLTKHTGFVNAIRLVMRLAMYGLLWLAPVCSSFVFCNAVNCVRTATNPAGDITYGPVRDGNLIADACAFLSALAHCRSAFFCLENPANSWIRQYGYVKLIFDWMNDLKRLFEALCDHCRFDTARLGQRVLKKFRLTSNGAFVADLNVKCRCLTGHVKLTFMDGMGKTHCNKLVMKKSQAYSKKFGAAVIASWTRHRAAIENPAAENSEAQPSAGQQQQQQQQQQQSPNQDQTEQPEEPGQTSGPNDWMTQGDDWMCQASSDDDGGADDDWMAQDDHDSSKLKAMKSMKAMKGKTQSKAKRQAKLAKKQATTSK